MANKVVEDGQVVSMHYVLTVDGNPVDSSDPEEPLQFIQGQGHIITGLENSVYGMAVGEAKDVVVSPADGYGDLDEEAFSDVPRGEFPAEIPLEIGLMLSARTDDGEEMDARIVQVTDEAVRLDFNHPLAGKELHFSIRIVDLRPATTEEIEHGHVH
jgi:FKBP-type peptidyl-prolyl cis-trans isomerase SlyD